MGQMYYNGDTMPHGARRLSSSMPILFVDRTKGKVSAQLVSHHLMGDWMEMDAPQEAGEYITMAGLDAGSFGKEAERWFYIPGTKFLAMIESAFSRVEVMGSDWDWHGLDDRDDLDYEKMEWKAVAKSKVKAADIDAHRHGRDQ